MQRDRTPAQGQRPTNSGAAGDADEELRRARSTGLSGALESLSSAAETLLSIGLDAEAREVSAVFDRLGGGRARPAENVFRREGDYRLVMYEADVFRLKETVGMGYLATLLARPGREIHVLELVGSNVALASDAGPVLDVEARRAYRQRIAELGDELADAERTNDQARAARCRDELKFLRAQLSSGEGLGGRDRASASTTERARQAATKALKSGLARIAAHSPGLGRHLASTIRTGTYCRYEPDSRLPISWRF